MFFIRLAIKKSQSVHLCFLNNSGKSLLLIVWVDFLKGFIQRDRTINRRLSVGFPICIFILVEEEHGRTDGHSSTRSEGYSRYLDPHLVPSARWTQRQTEQKKVCRACNELERAWQRKTVLKYLLKKELCFCLLPRALGMCVRCKILIVRSVACQKLV